MASNAVVKLLGWVDVCVCCVTIIAGKLHLNESQSYEDGGYLGVTGKSIIIVVPLFLDADIVHCRASNCEPSNLCSLTRYVSS